MTLTGLSITDVKHFGIRVLSDFTGTLAFSGICQQTAKRGLYDEGSAGVIVGNGVFRANSVMDVDLSKNRSAETCIQSHGSIPFPFYPTPEVPVSDAPVQNATGTNCMVYITARKVTEVIVDGTNLHRQSAVYLPVNQSIVIQYTGDLSWVWQRVT